MNHVLDTNVCIELLRVRNLGVISRYVAMDPSTIGIPSIVAAELLLGAAKSVRPNALMKVDEFISGHELLPFGEAEARQYAKIRAELEARGERIGPNDLLIAATAMVVEAALVTHNVREFARIQGLVLDDWHV